MLRSNHITLRLQRLMHLAHAAKRADLGIQDHRVIGFGQKVVAARFQALYQGIGLGQTGEKDDRHQVFTRLLLDQPGSLKAVHHRHKRIKQNNIWPTFGKLLYRHLAILGEINLVTQSLNQPTQNHTISRIVVGNQDG